MTAAELGNEVGEIRSCLSAGLCCPITAQGQDSPPKEEAAVSCSALSLLFPPLYYTPPLTFILEHLLPSDLSELSLAHLSLAHAISLGAHVTFYP